MTAADDIARVARAMLGEHDQLLDAVMRRVWETVPGYPQYVLEPSDLRARVGESVSNVILCLLEGREPSAAELQRTARNGERRALQGLSATAVIQSYRTAERILGDEFQGWCSRMQVRAPSARAGRAALIGHLDKLERAMLDAYSEIQAQIEAEQRLSETSLFRRLASGQAIDAAEIERLAVAIGLTNHEYPGFIAVAVTARRLLDRAAIEQYRHRVAAALGQARGSTVLSGTVERPHRAVVLLALPWSDAPERLVRDVEDALARVDDGALWAGLGQVAPGLGVLGVSCREALSALEATIPAEHESAQARVALYTESLLEVLVRRDQGVARQIAEHYLGPLLDRPALLTTLRAHLSANLALSATAAALDVHKNTVAYRLRRIEDLTGLDLGRPRDVARVVVALEARRAEDHTRD